MKEAIAGMNNVSLFSSSSLSLILSLACSLVSILEEGRRHDAAGMKCKGEESEETNPSPQYVSQEEVSATAQHIVFIIIIVVTVVGLCF